MRLLRPFTHCSLFLALGLAPASVLGQCAPGALGPPCASAGLAIAPESEPGLNLGAANPVHLVSGNKYQREVDLPANVHAPGLELVRHYNSLDPRAGSLGRGWQFSYDTRLYRVKNGWQIVQADGSRLHYPDGQGKGQATYQNRHGRLLPGARQHSWIWPDGTRLQFDGQGRLLALHWPNGNSIDIQRHPAGSPYAGAIARVAHAKGLALEFHHRIEAGQPRLEAVDTPLGRFHYRHDMPQGPQAPPRLIAMQRPDGMKRLYLHEPAHQANHPYALTGIALGDARGRQTVIGNWRYDRQGRAIHWASGRSSLKLDYRSTPRPGTDGLTIVHDPQGRQTRFHIGQRGQRYVLLSVEGAGCPGCAPPGTRAHYDEQGRLQAINDTRLERDTRGRLAAIMPARSGWPGLVLNFNSKGLPESWRSTATGLETIVHSPQGRPIVRRHANGDSMRIRYDARQRPIAITERHGSRKSRSELSWNTDLLVRIAHPAETEERSYHANGRLAARSVLRPSGDGRQRTYQDRFEYDALHRLSTHHLPEGGSLHYRYDARSRLHTVQWVSASGQRHDVIRQPAGQGARTWQWGNGLQMALQHDGTRPGRQRLMLHDQGRLVWAQERIHDAHGRIVQETTRNPGASEATGWRYAYDHRHRLAGAQAIAGGQSVPEPLWFAWQEDGGAAARTRDGKTLRPDWRHDASGLPLALDNRQLDWGANRRLAEVRQDGRMLLRQHHNAFGYRIRRESASGPAMEFFYLDRRLVAQVAAPSPQTLDRRYLYAGPLLVAFIDYSPARPEGELFAVHADLLGAPRVVTDHQKNIRWAADYTPLGQARIRQADLTLDVRLPGQFHDADTGWHDNLLRTYLPEWGQYLEPDPLGPVPGNQARGYAAQQPRRHADPLGLLLFAFDGTRQSADTQGNVWKLAQAYQDGPAHYHAGPGNSMYVDWDALTAHDARQIVDTQWQWLLLELSRAPADTVTPIDIIGFSRGAALARHFGNLISEQVDAGLFQIEDRIHGAISACVDLRFMGLFDTVAQFGVGGVQNRNYQLGIAPAWEWVAHAVALHERRWLFPLTTAADSAAANVVEVPLIGSHPDIGGGSPQGRPGSLADVALNWIHWQAQAASVPWGPLEPAGGPLDAPILHDYRSALVRSVQDGDRSVLGSGHQTLFNYQQDHPDLGGGPRARTESMIQRLPGWEAADSPEVGTVDMDAYGQWLREELGWPAPPV